MHCDFSMTSNKVHKNDLFEEETEMWLLQYCVEKLVAFRS